MVRQPTEERKQQIAQAALKIIAEQGLGKFTISAIAREVGLSDGALFRHFKSKEQIVLAAIEVLEEKMFQNFPPSGDDSMERLEVLIRERLEFLSDNPYFVRLIFTEQLGQASGKEGVKRVYAMQTRTVDFIRQCLNEAQESKLIRDDLSADQLAVILFGTVFGAAHHERYESTLPQASARTMSGHLWSTIETLFRR